MQLHIPTESQAFERALEAARRVNRIQIPHGLAAPLEGSLKGRVAEVWDSIETALRVAYTRGREAATALMDKAITELDKVVSEAGTRAQEVHSLLLERLNTYVKSFVR